MENLTNECPVPNDTPPVSERKIFKKKITFLSGGLLIYTAIMFFAVIATIVICSLYEVIMGILSKNNFDSEAFEDWLYNSDMGMSLGVILGCLTMIFFFMKHIKPKEIFRRRENKMTVQKFIMLVCVLMSIQFPISILDGLFESLLNTFGLSAQEAIESSKAGSESISMMLYAGFIGPFAEEFIYRGYTMQSLEKTGAGKGYALVISSVLFGIMHANPTQSIFAFFAGMVFSYTAIEYGIIWSLILHIANNFIFGDVLVFIYNRIPEDTANTIDFFIFVGLFIAGIVVLIANAKKISAYVKENYGTKAKYYGWTFTNILMLLFILINVLLAVSTIKKI